MLPTIMNDDVLPSRIEVGSREEMVRMGFSFGGVLTDRPQLTAVTLPPGWRKRLNIHPPWIEILDQSLRPRVYVFTFRSGPWMNVCTCFEIRKSWDYESGAFKSVVFRGATSAYKPQACEAASYTECVDWLNEHYPLWRDPCAYWDDPQ